MPDDTELLRRYAHDGSEAAFTELVQRHLNLVYSAALRRVGGDAHLAQDVTQQVFIALARQAGALSDRAVLAGWLYTTSRFASAQVVRAERRRQAREQEAHLMHDSTADSLADPDWARLRPVLDEVMDQLNEHEREALLLRFFESRSFAAVSEKLGLTEEAARKRVDRALDKLRGLLARRGVGSTLAAVTAMLETQAVTAAPTGLATTVAGAALTAPAGTSVSVVTLLQLMSTTKLTMALVVVGTFLAVGLATHEVRIRRETSAALAAARQDNDALLARLHAATREAGTAERSRGDLQKAVDAARAARAAEDAQAAADLADVRDPVAGGREFLAAHPEASHLVVTVVRARMIMRYASLFRTLGLTPGQVEQFVDLMVKGGEGGLRWNSDRQSPIGEFSLGDLSKEERENGFRDLLGDEGYRQYQEFNRIDAARQLTAQLGSAVYFTAAPLTPDQASQLVQILTQASADHQQGRAVSGSSIDWDAAFTRAQEVLSATQLAVLRDMREQMRFSQELNQAMNEARKAFSQGALSLPASK